MPNHPPATLAQRHRIRELAVRHFGSVELLEAKLSDGLNVDQLGHRAAAQIVTALVVVDGEDHRQVLEAYIMDNLVEGTL